MAAHKVTVRGFGTFDVEDGTKLVLAMEQNGVDVSHRCGGNARCTTCRSLVHSGDAPMGEVEKDCLVEDGELGNFRLSCQIRVHGDMEVEPLMLASAKGWDPGIEVEP